MFSPIGQPEADSFPMMQSGNNGSQTYSDTCHGSGGMMGRGGGMGHHFAGSMPNIIAEALNISLEELQTAHDEGKSVADLAEEKNVSIDELRIKVLETRKAELQQLVQDGDITQEQMDAMLVHMESMIDSAFQKDGTGFGHMNGRGGMGNGHHMNRGHMSFY